MRFNRVFIAGLLACGIAPGQIVPKAQISNGVIGATIYLPDAKTGFYRGTRFDWSGVISRLTFSGHQYYGPWFTKQDATVRDFVYRDADIVVSPESGSMGPADEFQTPLGYDAAPVGGTFIKVGVGVLRKPDARPYSAFAKYELVDPGKWSVKNGGDYVEFVQELNDPASGYAYVYRKVVRLTERQPQMRIEHSLKNTGKMSIHTNLYNHNFLTLDGMPTGPDDTITVPFEIKSSKPVTNGLAEIQGKNIVYLKSLQDKDTVAMPVEGFGPDPKDYDIRVENKKLGAGMRIVGDRPLASVALWSIRSVLAIEPFVAVAAEPGQEATWAYTYTYYTIPAK